MRMHTFEQRQSWKSTSSSGVRLKLDGGTNYSSLSQDRLKALKSLVHVSGTGRVPLWAFLCRF